MITYHIYSKDGSDFGSWDGGSPEEAFAAMVQQAGNGTNADGETLAGTIEDWEIIEEKS